MARKRNIETSNSVSEELETASIDDEFMDKVKAAPGKLPIKEFAPRNSVLTDLWDNKHIRTIYHIFLAMLIGLLINTAAYDYLYKGKWLQENRIWIIYRSNKQLFRVRLGFSLIIKGFSKFHLLILIWIGMFLSSFLVYAGFRCWATIRTQIPSKSPTLKYWDKLHCALFIMYYPAFMYFSTMSIIENEIPYAAALSLYCEVTRFIMKMHAFVRSNAPRVLKYKPHAEKQVLCPTLSQFLYFSFVPTLVYRDSYPRTKQIRWKYVALCFTEVIGAIFYLSFLFERFLLEIYEDFGVKPYTWQDITVIILRNAAAGMLIMLAAFYSVLHSWMNGFAEMLRFADRMFYKDWWTSSTYDRYYRTWNVIVHDWLYTYIYKDFYEVVLPKNKLAAKYMVFLMSALFHEYILGFTFRFCLPILFLQFFGLGVIFSFLKMETTLIGNVFLWYSNALGMSINTSAFAMEYFSRTNCPIEDESFASYFIPRMFSCGNRE